MVVEEMEGVVKLVVPVPPDSGLPPEELAYQSIVSPAITAPLIETVPVPYLEPSVLVGLEGNAFTVTVEVIIQPLLLVYVIKLVPEDCPVTRPVSLIVATPVVVATQALETAAVAEPVN